MGEFPVDCMKDVLPIFIQAGSAPLTPVPPRKNAHVDAPAERFLGRFLRLESRQAFLELFDSDRVVAVKPLRLLLYIFQKLLANQLRNLLIAQDAGDRAGRQA